MILPLRRIFAFPAMLAMASLAGLLVALTGDGWRDAAAWIALAAPLGTLAFAYFNRIR